MRCSSIGGLFAAVLDTQGLDLHEGKGGAYRLVLHSEGCLLCWGEGWNGHRVLLGFSRVGQTLPRVSSRCQKVDRSVVVWVRRWRSDPFPQLRQGVIPVASYQQQIEQWSPPTSMASWCQNAPRTHPGGHRFSHDADAVCPLRVFACRWTKVQASAARRALRDRVFDLAYGYANHIRHAGLRFEVQTEIDERNKEEH